MCDLQSGADVGKPLLISLYLLLPSITLCIIKAVALRNKERSVTCSFVTFSDYQLP